MLKDAEILKFIQDDAVSMKKQNAKIGEEYYEGDHEIRNYKLYYYDADGNLIEDKSRSNIKISHPFFTELVDQEAQYMLGAEEGFIKSDNPELQTYLDEYFNENEDFTSELNEVLTGSISKGFEYMYAYKAVDGKIAFQCADALGVVEVRAKDSDDATEYVIYWYIDRMDKGTKPVKRIQVWDSQQTHFFVQVEEGKLEKDASQKINPRPHIMYHKPNDPATYYEGFGFIPFFRLDNNRKQVSGLKTIKALIDDYDLMSCGLSNNLQDASEYLVVVSGFQGDSLDELIQNTKTKKHIGVETGGNVDFKTVNVPYDARKTKLELDEKNIYRFGMGFNSAQLGDGNITNIVIKSRYALLDLKCNKLEIRLKQFLRKIIKVVLAEVNTENETDYQMKDVYFDFNREVMTNAQDNAIIEKTDAEKQQIQINTLLSLSMTLGDDIVIQNICDALDLDYDDIKGKIPEKVDPATEMNALTNDLSAIQIEE